MPRKKVEKPEVVEEKPVEIMDTTPDGQEEAVLSDPDKNHSEGTEGENRGEEISEMVKHFCNITTEQISSFRISLFKWCHISI